MSAEPVAFGGWLTGLAAALRGEADSDVACGTCTACCRSRQFVLIEPDELDALAHIPHELLVPAPNAPPGHRLMGYDTEGRCPMVGDDGCTIYAHRPRTCRVYDCRVFPAAGVFPDERDKAAIAERARGWTFAHPTDVDRALHDAVLAEAAALRAAEPDLPATPLAVRSCRRIALTSPDTA